MRVYALTEVGRKARSGEGDADEMRILRYFDGSHKTATDSELEIVGDRYVLKTLVRRGLVKELTT